MSYDELSDDVAFDVPAKEQKAAKTGAEIRQSVTLVESALTEFEKVSAGLAMLNEKFPADLVYDVSTGKGMVEAVAHRAAWREPRLAVERLRKQAKAPVLTLGKDIDARAAWLTEQLLIGEKPIDEQIKAEEARKERIKQDRIEAEFGRVQAMQEAIAEISMAAMAAAGKTSAQIAALLEEARETVLDPLVFQEMMPQAQAAQSAVIAKLEMAHKAALHTEAEAAKLAADRAELEQLRKAAAEQRAKDEAAAKIEQAKRAEEQARIAAEQKKQADALAEQQRAMAEREAAMAKREAEAKAAQEKAEREAAEKLAAEQEAARIAALPKPEPVKPAITVELEEAPAYVPPAPEAVPTLKLGTINERLGLIVTGDFMAALGFQAVKVKQARLFHESDWQAIKQAIAAHVLAA